MLKITILQIGKTKEKELQSLIDEYYKRVSSSVKLETVTVSSEDDLIGKIPKSAYVIKLEDSGKEFTSQEFAQFIEDRKNQGDSHLVFLIGPPDGFQTDIASELTLSLSKMTFSHQTIRLILAEQIYRASSTLEGKPFAK